MQSTPFLSSSGTIRPLLVLTLLCALASTAVAADTVVLSYGNAVGRAWDTRLTIEAHPPIGGRRALSAVYHQRVHGGQANRLSVAVAVDRTPNPYYGTPIGPFSADLTLAFDGTKPVVTGALVNDDYQGTFVKDSAFLFFPLPPGPVGPGQSWQWQALLHMPATEHLGLPSSFQRTLKVRGRSTLDYVDSRGMAHIRAQATERDEKNARLVLEGELLFDIANGRLARGVVAGTMSARKLFIWVDADVRLTFESTGRGQVALEDGTGISMALLNVRD